MDYIGFDINSQIEPINTDLTITFNPDTNYSSYKLVIYKDNNIYKEISKINTTKTTITLSETGTYKIDVVYYDLYMNENIISSDIYNIDKDAPTIKLEKKYIELNQNDEIDVNDYIIVNDNYTKNLKITTNYSELDLNTKGIKKLTYTVTDEAGNTSNSDMTIKVLPSSTSVLIFQIIFMTILFIILIGILIYNKSIKLEKRISRFSITPLKDNTISLLDRTVNITNKIVKSINKLLYKSEFIKKYSKRYFKYINGVGAFTHASIDFVSIKIISAIIFLIIAIFSTTIQTKVFYLYNAYIPLIFGFFIPDFIYHFKYKTYKKKLENDLLEAIIIMNNAFKSGRSIVQAIDLVSHELTGPMAEEFKKMHLELSFGLSIDVVFERFSSRINIEEASYLTASLTILNKSGGNIIEVFSSIEKSLFNKKKLRLELASLTSGSKMITNILMVIPILFVILIHLVNPGYFIPLLTNKIGPIIIGITIIYYVIYIIIVRKTLRVKI